MLISTVFLATIAAHCSATYLYVSSYAGNVTTLSLTESNGTYSLQTVAQNALCAPNPAWLTLDRSHNRLYCLNEGLTSLNGSISSFALSRNGSLSLLSNVSTINGPVASVIYGTTPNRAIALAHYVGSAVSTFAIDDCSNGTTSPLQNFTFSLSQPGPNAARQEAPHAHDAVLDPTGQYIIVPDLGADLVRVFGMDADTGVLNEETPLSVAPGSGPRHAEFYSPSGLACENCTLYLYVVGELAGTITAYRVTYPAAGGLAFEEVYTTNTYGGGALPAGIAPAEIEISPDNRFLIVSNRNDSRFGIPNPDPNNSTSVVSDSLATFALNADGSLAFTQLWPAGGSFPRHFSLNRAGNLVAVALQRSSRVVIWQRNVILGALTSVVAYADVEGQVNTVIWDE